MAEISSPVGAGPVPQPGPLQLPTDRQLVLRVMPMPADANGNGDIFGGWIMAQVDLAGAVLPARMGFACFQPLVPLPGFVVPLHVANTILPYDPRLPPPGPTATGAPAPGEVIAIPAFAFSPGDSITVQGILGDGNSRSRKPVSITNALVVRIE